MQKEIICTVCPRGCHIQVIGDGKTVTSLDGYGCKRGITYAEAEYSAPVRILTTTVKIAGKNNELLPVRSDKPIAKDKILACMGEIKKVSATIPVKRYDIIVADILGTGVNIVATKDI
jgi:CxxC motif-containing protein